MSEKSFAKEAIVLLRKYNGKNKKFSFLFDWLAVQFKQKLIGFLCLSALNHCTDTIKFVQFFMRCLHKIFEVKEDFQIVDIKNLPIERFVSDTIGFF